MKITGLHYKGDEGSFSVYQYFHGGRPIFEVAVDNNDTKLSIYVGKISATWAYVKQIGLNKVGINDLFKTDGHAAWMTKDDVTHISGDSVRRYIHPRAFAILANLFVPKDLTVAESFED